MIEYWRNGVCDKELLALLSCLPENSQLATRNAPEERTRKALPSPLYYLASQELSKAEGRGKLSIKAILFWFDFLMQNSSLVSIFREVLRIVSYIMVSGGFDFHE